jgi:hypothetical protein
LIRASDPVFEIGARLGIVHRMEDGQWHTTLQNLAADLGSTNRQVEQKNICVDKRVQWSEAKNVWHNAAIRTVIYTPVHLARRITGRAWKE